MFNIHENWKLTITAILIIIGAAIITRVSRWLIGKSYMANSKRLRIDKTRSRFFQNAISLIIWILAIGTVISLIPRLKHLAVTLFASAGILIAIAGFAAQQAFSNIISGVFIVMFRPFRVGDMIKVGTLEYGIVEDITLRHTVIINFENKRIIIPNSVVSSDSITNNTIGDTKICEWIEVGISYDSDIDLATKIIQEESIDHPYCIDNRTKKEKNANEPQVSVRVLDFGDFSINLRAYVWLNDPLRARQMHSDINIAIKKRFDKEGVEIPFPYRTLVYKKDLKPNS